MPCDLATGSRFQEQAVRKIAKFQCAKAPAVRSGQPDCKEAVRRGGMPGLEKIIDIQKVGRFEKLNAPSSLRFSQVTLVFGENGWGKSTLADILRSLTRNHPDII